MKGTKIIVTENPKGYRKPCTINGTPKPGTVMEIDYEVAAVGGVFTWQPYGTTAASSGQGVASDGDRKIIAVLLERWQDGSTYNDAYADEDHGELYFPLPGDELNMIIENQPGTGDSFSIGDEMMLDDGTGKLLACDDNAEAHPFTVLETVAGLTADTHAWCMFTGGAG